MRGSLCQLSEPFEADVQTSRDTCSAWPVLPHGKGPPVYRVRRGQRATVIFKQSLLPPPQPPHMRAPVLPVQRRAVVKVPPHSSTHRVLPHPAKHVIVALVSGLQKSSRCQVPRNPLDGLKGVVAPPPPLSREPPGPPRAS